MGHGGVSAATVIMELGSSRLASFPGGLIALDLAPSRSKIVDIVGIGGSV